MRGFRNVEPSGVDSNFRGFKGLRKPALTVCEVCIRCFTPWWVSTWLGFDLSVAVIYLVPSPTQLSPASPACYIALCYERKVASL